MPLLIPRNGRIHQEVIFQPRVRDDHVDQVHVAKADSSANEGTYDLAVSCPQGDSNWAQFTPTQVWVESIECEAVAPKLCNGQTIRGAKEIAAPLHALRIGRRSVRRTERLPMHALYQREIFR